MEATAELQSLAQTERSAIVQALRHYGGNRTHAARSLVISIRTLQRKLKADPTIEREAAINHDAVTRCTNDVAC